MKNLKLRFVLKQIPYSILYLLLGLFVGAISSYIFFSLNPYFLKFILGIWFRRILLGISLFEEYPAFWFILNNTIALLVIIFASWFILTNISKTPEFLITKKFRRLKKHRGKIILSGLYIIPLGSLLINGFLISLFVTYVFLNFGFDVFAKTLLLLLPHGITESSALLLASSLGFSYLKILSPYILNSKWNLCSKKLKKLLFSRCSLFVIFLIIILVLFSGILEGILSFLIKLK